MYNVNYTGVYVIFIQTPAIDISSEDGVAPEVLEGNVDFKDISFTYPSRPDIQVRDRNLHLVQSFVCLSYKRRNGIKISLEHTLRP